MKKLLPLFLLLIVTLSGTVPIQGAPGLGTLQQATAATEVRLMAVDASQFPEVKVTVSVLNQNGAFVSGLQAADFQIREDGTSRNPASAVVETRGVAVAFVVDLSTSMGPGRAAMTGAPTRLDEAKDLIPLFIDQGLDPNLRDRVAVVGFHRAITPTLPATYDYTMAKNYVATMQAVPEADAGYSRLYDGVDKALDLVARPDTQNMRRVVFILADGEENRSSLGSQALVNKAKAAHVPIYAILLRKLDDDPDRWNAEARQYWNTLDQLTAATGGRTMHYVLDTQKKNPQLQLTREELLAIFQQVTTRRDQYVLAYRSQVASSGSHKVVVTVGSVSGGEESDAPRLDVTVQPPAVALTGPSEMEHGRDVKLTATVTFPDGHPRQVREVQFYLSGPQSPGLIGVVTDTITANQCELTWNTSILRDEGEYTFSAVAKDELGLTSPQGATPKIRLVIPLTVKSLWWLQANYMLLCATGLISALLLLLMVLVVRKRQVIWETSKRIGKTVTERLAGRKPPQPLAELVVIGGPETGKRYVLTAEQTRIGREPTLSDLVLTDKTVSRLHATIRQDATGNFFIVDEGAVNLTYVNNRPLAPRASEWLYHGVHIGLGSTLLEFRTTVGGGVTPPPGSSGDTTQPVWPGVGGPPVPPVGPAAPYPAGPAQPGGPGQYPYQPGPAQPGGPGQYPYPAGPGQPGGPGQYPYPPGPAQPGGPAPSPYGTKKITEPIDPQILADPGKTRKVTP